MRGDAVAACLAHNQDVVGSIPTPATSLRLIHVELKEANDFVGLLHRHHKPVVGHRFSVGVANGILRGVAICGRPVARLCAKDTLEVTRVCTDGTKNACSMLYGACARAGAALGYKKIQT